MLKKFIDLTQPRRIHNRHGRSGQCV